MIRLINNANRALGLPGAPSVILEKGGFADVTQDHFEGLMENKTVAAWVSQGIVGVHEQRSDQAGEKPAESAPKTNEKPTSPGVQVVAKGGGWFRVLVNGVDVAERSLRKDEAEAMAAEYE